MAPRGAPSTFTSFFVHNLHCSRCEKLLKDSLQQLDPPPRNVKISLAIRRVSIEHAGDLDSAEILKQLRRLGFLIADDFPLPSRWQRVKKLQFMKRTSSHSRYCLNTQNVSSLRTSQQVTPGMVPFHLELQESERDVSCASEAYVGDNLLIQESGDHRYDSWMG